MASANENKDDFSEFMKQFEEFNKERNELLDKLKHDVQSFKLSALMFQRDYMDERFEKQKYVRMFNNLTKEKEYLLTHLEQIHEK